MPGKYLEYINAGRFTVPVEISFLQATLTDELLGKEEYSSKWAERDDWKEIKTLLKPAVENCLKYNDVPCDKVPKVFPISFGQLIGLGYTLNANKDKSPFHAVLDAKRNCWTDDEDEEVDENSGFRNFGGSFKAFIPSKLYIKVGIVKKTFSNTDDGKRLQKFLGTGEDIRQYCKSSNSNDSELVHASKDKIGNRYAFREAHLHRSSLDGSRDHGDRDFRSNGIENGRGIDIIATNGRWPINTLKPSPPDKDTFWKNGRTNLDGESYYEEKDDDDEEAEDEDPPPEPNPPTPLFRNHMLADDDDSDSFSLPDIPDTPLTMRNADNIERKYSDDPPSSSSQDKSPSFEGLQLDVNNILRQAGNSSTGAGKKYDNVFDSSTSPQKRKPHNQSQEDVSFAETLSSLDAEYRKMKKPRGAAAIKKRKLSKDITASPDKKSSGSSPSRKLVSSLSSPSKASTMGSKFPKIPHRSPKALKIPVYFRNGDKKKAKEKEKVPPAPKPPAPAKPPPIREKSPRPRFKKDRRKRRISTSSISSNSSSSSSSSSSSASSGPDPEMPVLEKMVDDVEIIGPSPGTLPLRRLASPLRFPKIEPVTSRDEPVTAPKTVQPHVPEISAPVPRPISAPKPVEPSVPVETPAPVAPKKKSKSRKKMKGKGKRKQQLSTADEETQTNLSEKSDTSRNGSVAVNMSEMPTQPLSLSEFIQNTHAHASATQISNYVSAASSLANTAIISNFHPTPTPPSPLEESEDDDDDEANLFSFEHLSKISSPNVMPKPKTSTISNLSNLGISMSSLSSRAVSPPSPPILSHYHHSPPIPMRVSTPPSTTTNSTMPTIMPPPVKRPPRTPKKNFPPSPTLALALPTATSSSSMPSNRVNSIPISLATGPGPSSSHPPRLAIESAPGPSTSTSSAQPNAMSTYQLILNDKALLAGLGLFTELASKKLNAEELGFRLGIQQAPERPKRPVSPDICLGPAVARMFEKQQSEILESRLRPRKNGGNSSSSSRGNGNGRFSGLARSISELQDGEAQENSNRYSEEVFGELFIRNQNAHMSINPQGDEFDMSQKSLCMLGVFPQYEQKSRTYKMHSKNIAELSLETLVQHFHFISPQILDIFTERIPSERHDLFKDGGQKTRKDLKELNVSVPFNHQHGMTLMNMLADLLVPDQHERPMWTEYINFVMLPETFIRIYAHVNQISYKRAETELRFGACYDDDSIPQ